MTQPFKRLEPQKKGVASAFRRRSSITLERVEDLLAQAACVQDVAHDSVQAICAERGVDLARSLGRGRAGLYARYLRHCLEDKVLSAEENADLSHLRDVLMLSPGETHAVHDAIAIEVYGEAVHEVLADFHLDDAEKQFLERLRDDLQVPEQRADEIFRAESAAARNMAINQASSRDEEFSRHRVAAGQFVGRSTDSLEAAIDDAIRKATVVVPRLHWFEVIETAGYVEDGAVSGWHVSIRAGIRTDELE